MYSIYVIPNDFNATIVSTANQMIKDDQLGSSLAKINLLLGEVKLCHYILL